MKITVLVDNNTITDKYFYAEPALSLFIEVKDKKILFDTGYSDIFIKNAIKSGTDISSVDYVILSHGHDDHSGGLKYLTDFYKNKKNSPPLIIAGQEFFNKRYDSTGEFGCPVSKKELEKIFELKISPEPLWINDDIVFLGKIPNENDFEHQSPCGISGNYPDYVNEDSAIAVKLPQGLVIVSGCAHAGIVNICEYAKRVCHTEKIISIIGGLHLHNADKAVIQKTCGYIKNLQLDSLFACHCTGLKAKCSLNSAANLQEVGSGLIIEF